MQLNRNGWRGYALYDGTLGGTTHNIGPGIMLSGSGCYRKVWMWIMLLLERKVLSRQEKGRKKHAYIHACFFFS